MIDLVKVLRNNPGAVALIDNDCWTLHKQHPDDNPFDYETEEEKYDAWNEKNTLVSSNDDLKPMGGDYGYSGNIHGGAILQALAIICEIHIESV